MSKYKSSNLTSLLNEKYLGEEEKPQISKEQKKAFMEAVAAYHTYGESIYRNQSLREITEKIKEVVKIAENLTLQESEHWFDNMTVSRHMKQLGEAYKVFEKTSKEVTALQQRMESAYEDIGSVLNKYYKVNEALK
jgi:phosphoribosylamine-glycine ligase